MYYLQDDAQRYWPKRGMLAYSLDAAQSFATRESAEKQLRKIHNRSPKGPFVWKVIEVE